MTHLNIAYEDLRNATIAVGKAQSNYHRDRNTLPTLEAAIYRHEKCLKAFGGEVSKVIRETEEIPDLAIDMVWYQRNNGFMAKGLAKIIRDHQG